MPRGPKPDRKRWNQIARLRAEGLGLAEIGRRLGVRRQTVHWTLCAIRKARGRSVPCAGCGAAVASAGALPGDAGKALCLGCLARRPGAATWQRLKAFRLAAGLLQKELARKAGVRDEMVRRYEQGHYRPRTAALARLARALDVPPQALEPGGPVPRELPRAK